MAKKMKFYFPTQECKYCCGWAHVGRDTCVYHTHNKPKEVN